MVGTGTPVVLDSEGIDHLAADPVPLPPSVVLSLESLLDLLLYRVVDVLPELLGCRRSFVGYLAVALPVAAAIIPVAPWLRLLLAFVRDVAGVDDHLAIEPILVALLSLYSFSSSFSCPFYPFFCHTCPLLPFFRLGAGYLGIYISHGLNIVLMLVFLFDLLIIFLVEVIMQYLGDNLVLLVLILTHQQDLLVGTTLFSL